MKLNNKAYDAIKYIVLIAIPALNTAYLGIDSAVDLPYEVEVVKVSMVLATLLGTLVGISKLQYNYSDAKYDGVIDPYRANVETSSETLKFKDSPSDVSNQKTEVLLKVTDITKETS